MLSTPHNVIKKEYGNDVRKRSLHNTISIEKYNHDTTHEYNLAHNFTNNTKPFSSHTIHTATVGYWTRSSCHAQCRTRTMGALARTNRQWHKPHSNTTGRIWTSEKLPLETNNPRPWVIVTCDLERSGLYYHCSTSPGWRLYPRLPPALLQQTNRIKAMGTLVHSSHPSRRNT